MIWLTDTTRPPREEARDTAYCSAGQPKGQRQSKGQGKTNSETWNHMTTQTYNMLSVSTHHYTAGS